MVQGLGLSAQGLGQVLRERYAGCRNLARVSDLSSEAFTI